MTMASNMSDSPLFGGVGRAAFYRPARKRARDLFSRDAECFFSCDDVKYPVLDLSASGFLFASPNGKVWNPGSEIKGQLILHGEPVLDSTVRVARVEALARGCHVGVDAQQTLALSEMLELDAERTFIGALERGPAYYAGAASKRLRRCGQRHQGFPTFLPSPHGPRRSPSEE